MPFHSSMVSISFVSTFISLSHSIYFILSQHLISFVSTFISFSHSNHFICVDFYFILSQHLHHPDLALFHSPWYLQCFACEIVIQISWKLVCSCNVWLCLSQCHSLEHWLCKWAQLIKLACIIIWSLTTLNSYKPWLNVDSQRWTLNIECSNFEGMPMAPSSFHTEHLPSSTLACPTLPLPLLMWNNKPQRTQMPYITGLLSTCVH